MSDPAADHAINELYARIGALERLVAVDIARRWGRDRCEAWYDLNATTNDVVPSPTELGRAMHRLAIDRLGRLLRKYSSPAPGPATPDS